MENITIKDIVEACSGQLLCGDENKGIKEFSIDSRSGSEDSIFVPIIGERVDAHKFIDGALKINEYLSAEIFLHQNMTNR